MLSRLRDPSDHDRYTAAQPLVGLWGARGLDLHWTYLTRATLKKANLSKADLVKARGLTQEQIEWAIGDKETTKLTEGLHPPELWSRSVEEQKKVVRGDQ